MRVIIGSSKLSIVSSSMPTAKARDQGYFADQWHAPNRCQTEEIETGEQGVE